jgi:hypothetical protein
MIRLRSLFACVALAQEAPPAAEQSELSVQNVLGTLLAYGAGAVVFVTLVVLALKLLARRRGGRDCTNADCGAENDPRARFCRRCGKALS